jgi:serine/threonine-protein kinase
VAIKILPDEVARDPERLARFEREAQLLAALNHPNIGAIYGVEESGGTRCLVLELVEGETLAARIDQGALSTEEALRLALQIAEGLEAAHDKGIVHRDLKPANVMIGAEGAVKVLDFGLAKALEEESAGGGSASLSPTMTAAATRLGIILGTAGYMSPEQARGKAVDRRADIWAFGVILFEMLSGGRMFTGETVSDTLAGVLRAELDWKLLPGGTPPPIRRLLKRCLDRDAKRRLRDIGEARIILADWSAGRLPEEAPAPAGPAPRRGMRARIAGGAVALALAGLAFALAWSFKPAPALPHRVFQIPVENLQPGPSYAVSPDGLSVVFVTPEGLRVRRLDKLEAREMPGTKGAAVPFWSPDSQWIGYFADSKLKKVALSGGEATVICELPESLTRGAGASWGSKGTIALAGGSGLIYAVPERGGDPKAMFKVENSEEDHFHEPAWLPEEKGLIFTVHGKQDRGINVLGLFHDGKRETLIELEGQELWRPVYSSTGHILFRRQPDNDGIWALPFSAASLKVEGEAFLVAPQGNSPSVSNDGTLVSILGGGSGMQQLVWVDRAGEVLEALGQPQPDIIHLSLSPDGKQAAVHCNEADNWDVWIQDLQRATKMRLTFEKVREGVPVWSPTGDRIIYGQEYTLMVRAADGTGEPLNLGKGWLPSVSPDGQWIVYENQEGSQMDLWIRPLSQGGEAKPFLQSPSIESSPRISPDGRYVAYASNESGQTEVFLKRFPSGEGKWQVSVSGGMGPIWSRDGKEIIYRQNDLLMAVSLSTVPSVTLSTPKLLFAADEKGLSVRPRAFDMSPDGRRILTVKNLESGSNRKHLIVTTNWLAQFEPK